MSSPNTSNISYQHTLEVTGQFAVPLFSQFWSLCQAGYNEMVLSTCEDLRKMFKQWFYLITAILQEEIIYRWASLVGKVPARPLNTFKSQHLNIIWVIFQTGCGKLDLASLANKAQMEIVPDFQGKINSVTQKLFYIPSLQKGCRRDKHQRLSVYQTVCTPWGTVPFSFNNGGVLHSLCCIHHQLQPENPWN